MRNSKERGGKGAALLSASAAFTLICIGFLFGALFRVPLIPWMLPEGASSIVGAALGAFIAVGAAAWITQRQARARWRRSRNLLLGILLPVRVKCVAASVAATKAEKASTDQERDRHLFEFCGELSRICGEVRRALGRMNHLAAPLANVDPVFAVAAADATSMLETAQDEFGSLVTNSNLVGPLRSAQERVVVTQSIRDKLNNELARIMGAIGRKSWLNDMSEFGD